MFDDLLQANAAYAENFGLGHLKPEARRTLALLTCMDSRIEPLAMLGLQPGDAKIVRNAGGRATDDALRSLVLASNLLGVTRIAVMHHTGCAMISTNDAIATKVGDALGVPSPDWDFHPIDDPVLTLRADVAAVRACPLIPATTTVTGWVYDTSTGEIAVVVAP